MRFAMQNMKTAAYWKMVRSKPVGTLFYHGAKAKMECADAHLVLSNWDKKLLVHIVCKNYGPSSELDFAALMRKMAQNCDDFQSVDSEMQHVLLVVCPKYAPIKIFGQKKTGDALDSVKKVRVVATNLVIAEKLLDLTVPVDMTEDEWRSELEKRAETKTAKGPPLCSKASKLKFSFHYCVLDEAALENLGFDMFVDVLKSD